ncbi:Glyoxalase/bleomycin resistance protein/dioxygenase [Alkaliphilus metalliredigens QYMF]|uniref:Glyoxalase/bleomycin resistance protein/dioxygenase n=1 Tax=Alkaliphilus metalliredigens (strain QYMF) TaxID=293826 RepID=A6TX75_ALKMQ|nr:VOC family protein [Alkaliphilus metalliredigens]ABR50793.1 Glyoxalase/bleomycin resistance protein/dioxygenase [Alkaliphilus metalliredigens QYMF]
MSKYHRPPNTFVGQVDIKVGDLERTLNFYQGVLGFTILENHEGKITLTADGKLPLIKIEQPEDIISKESQTTGLYHFAILLPSRADLGTIIKKLREISYPLQGGSHHGISEAIYLEDPDGNGIEIYADTPPSTWKWENGVLPAEGKALDIKGLLAEAEDKEWKGIPSEALIGHIHLSVSELEKTEAFYHQGMGFDVVMRIPRNAVFFSTGEYHHHIGTNIWNGIGAPAPSENSVGMSSFSVVFPSDEAREKVIKKLRDLNYQVKKEEGVFITEDPSGNQIRLVVSRDI